MRAQAALEFLITYGWAIMALAVILAILFSTGVFNTNRYVEESCFLGPNFDCYGQVVKSPSGLEVALNITNLNPYPVYVDVVKLKSSSSGSVIFNVGQKIPPYGSVIVSHNLGQSDIHVGQVLTFQLNLTYYICPQQFQDSSGNCHLSPSARAMSTGQFVTRVASS